MVKFVRYSSIGLIIAGGRDDASCASRGKGGGASGMAQAALGQYGRRCTSGQENDAGQDIIVNAGQRFQTRNGRTRLGDEVDWPADLRVIHNHICSVVCEWRQCANEPLFPPFASIPSPKVLALRVSDVRLPRRGGERAARDWECRAGRVSGAEE